MKPNQGRWFWWGCGCLNILLMLSTCLGLFAIYMDVRHKRTEKFCEPYMEDDWDYRPERCILNVEDIAAWGTKIAAEIVMVMLGVGLALWLLLGAGAWITARRLRRIEADAYRSDLLG